MTVAAVLASTDVSVAAQALSIAEQTLRDPGGAGARLESALATIAAVAFRWPELPREETVLRVASLVGAANLPDNTCRLAGAVLQSLLTTPVGDRAGKALVDLLAERDRSGLIYDIVMEALRYAVAWAPGCLDPDRLLAVLAADHLGDHRRSLAQEVIEPCLYRAGDELSELTFDRFAELCGREAFFRYVCFNLTARRDVPLAVREKAQQFIAGAFAWRDQLRLALGGGPRRVLVVQNIRDGQGDEIVRCVPLMQALLDFNPRLEITLITGCPHLYSHPRLTVAPIRDRALVEGLLRSAFDAVIDFFAPNGPAVNHVPDLEAMVQAGLDGMRPRVVVGRSDLVYQRFELDGRPLAEDLGLDRRRVENVHEPDCRLFAEWGLPMRCGEASPASEPVLTGVPSPHAEAAWAGLTSRNSSQRPVAVLQPFSEDEALSGYTGRSAGSLSLQVRRLIDAGFYVVLLPSGAPARAPGLLGQAIAGLAPAEQAQVVAAAAPRQATDLFLRFVRFADLVVTVQGWALQAAYCLGKPYRILSPPLSRPPSWRPYLATRNQRGVAEESVSELSGDEAPLPQQPLKFTFLMALRELGRTSDPQAIQVLRNALDSEDREVRLAALVALSNLAGAMQPAEWRRLLDDTDYRVRAAAATALLGSRLAGLPRVRLEAYRRLGDGPTALQIAVELGDAARPALEAAAEDDDLAIRFEATRALQLLELKTRLRPERPGIGRRLARLLRPERRPAVSRKSAGGSPGDKVLILTPVKDAAGCIEQYCRGLSNLAYPHEHISLGFLESDSRDATYADLERRLPQLREQFRRAELWKRDFGYRIPAGLHRWDTSIQDERRSILARSRNHLLFHALDDEDWVLWLDADVIEYPPDIIERLLATGRDIVQPHCVTDYGGASYDWNAWRDQGRLRLDELRAEGDLVQLDAVGGTMLLVRADLHRDGLVFPPYLYGKASAGARPHGEIETEGLGIMARDMGHVCWGMPHLEIRHRRW